MGSDGTLSRLLTAPGLGSDPDELSIFAAVQFEEDEDDDFDDDFEEDFDEDLENIIDGATEIRDSAVKVMEDAVRRLDESF